MVKLVLTDMDNTLVAYEIPASQRAIEGVHKLLDKGVLFGPASGRDYDSVLISFRGDTDCVKTALFSNGKRIFVDGTLMNQTGVDRDSMVKMAEMVYDLPGVYVSGRGEGGGFVTGSTLPSLLGTTWGGRRAAEPAGDHVGRPSRERARHARRHPALDHRHGGPPLRGGLRDDRQRGVG